MSDHLVLRTDLFLASLPLDYVAASVHLFYLSVSPIEFPGHYPLLQLSEECSKDPPFSTVPPAVCLFTIGSAPRISPGSKMNVISIQKLVCEPSLDRAMCVFMLECMNSRINREDCRTLLAWTKETEKYSYLFSVFSVAK